VSAMDFASLVAGVAILSVVIGVLVRQAKRRAPAEHEFGEDGIMSQTTSDRICPATGCAVEPGSPQPACVQENGSCAHWHGKGIEVPCVRPDCPRPRISGTAARMAA
jgi:hypothetical protein